MSLRALKDDATSATKLRSLARSSKLTMLLGNALCGGSHLAFLGTLSPLRSSVTENLATLQLLEQVRSIHLSRAVEVSVFDAGEVSRGLAQEIAQLHTAEQSSAPHVRSQLLAAQSLRSSLEQPWEDAKAEA